MSVASINLHATYVVITIVSNEGSIIQKPRRIHTKGAVTGVHPAVQMRILRKGAILLYGAGSAPAHPADCANTVQGTGFRTAER